MVRAQPARGGAARPRVSSRETPSFSAPPLLAQRGELADAELELGRAGPHEGTGWRSVSRHTVEAFVGRTAGTHRRRWPRHGAHWPRSARAPSASASGPPLDAAIALAKRVGQPRAHGDRRGAVGARRCVPGRAGPLPPCPPDRDTRVAPTTPPGAGRRTTGSGGAGRKPATNADQVVRAHWRQLKPVLWQALADGRSTRAGAPGAGGRLPGGEALIAFTDHPQPPVRQLGAVGRPRLEPPGRPLATSAELSRRHR